MNLAELPQHLLTLLQEGGGNVSSLQAAVDAIADAFEARTVTLHSADATMKSLTLVAQKGLPEKMMPVIQKIPFGKGMAGICVERLEPVTVCNLQTDATGAAKPGAKETGVAGAIVFPVFSHEAGPAAGTLGIGKAEEHEYSKVEREVIADCARILGPALASS
jgi:signal transduction protein with GAF and PtsI domain